MIPDPTRIAFAGDWHMNGPWGSAMIYLAKANGAEAILHCGDFGYNYNKTFLQHIRHALDATGINLYFVDGNHDDHPLLRNRWVTDEDGFKHSQYGGRGNDNLHYIPRGHRWTWNGKVFMGVGGAISVDRARRQDGVSYWHDEAISYSDVEYAAREGHVDIILSHDIPATAEMPNHRKSGRGYWPDDVMIESENNRRALQVIVDATEPELLVHGHFHGRMTQMVGQLKIVSLSMDGTGPAQNMWFMNADGTEHTPNRVSDEPPTEIDDDF